MPAAAEDAVQADLRTKAPAAYRESAASHLQLGVLALAPAFALWGGIARRWMSDDGFINLRVVTHLLQGHGPVFNTGERVEAFTSPLWVAIVALVSALGAGKELAAVWVALVLGAVAVALAQCAAKLRCRPHADSERKARVWWLPAAAIMVVALPAVWDYLSSGLETSLSLAWLSASYLLLNLAWRSYVSGTSPALASVLCGSAFVGLGPLVRPELSIFAGCWLLAWLSLELRLRVPGRTRRVLVMVAASALLPLAYQVFRMGYYAAVVPNTAIAKMAHRARWQQGLHYAENFFGTYQLWLPLAVVIAWLVSEALRSGSSQPCAARLVAAFQRWLPPLCGLLYTLYVIRSGGGFMHGRQLIPPLFGALLPVMVVGMPRRSGGWTVRLHWAGWGALVAWALVCAATLRISPKNKHGIGDERGWYARQARRANPVTVKDYAAFGWFRDADRMRKRFHAACQPVQGDACERTLILDEKAFGVLVPHKRSVPLRDTVASSVIGAFARYPIGIQGFVAGSKLLLVDRGGLANELASRQWIAGRRRPGHERLLRDAWIVAAYGKPTASEDRRATAARQALGCGALRELEAAVHAPLTARRFWRNFSQAWSLTRLQVPANPFKARDVFCGPKQSTHMRRGPDTRVRLTARQPPGARDSLVCLPSSRSAFAE